jgi:agmatine deiminase
MILDQQTNFLYLADSLLIKFPSFARSLEDKLSAEKISFTYLPGTKDVWAKDYMPIQISKDRFIQFVYQPDYLTDSAKWKKSISDVNKICAIIGLQRERSDIVLDGGNIIRCNNRIIMSNKVFSENSSFSEKNLIRALERLFEVDNIIFVPREIKDKIGHADGMVRFLNNNTVLINSYADEDKVFRLSIITALLSAGLEYETIPYNPYSNRSHLQANGVYINYLQMDKVIIVPVFGMKEDEWAVKTLESLFPASKVIPVNSNEIAKHGGVLNCISWNILK